MSVRCNLKNSSTSWGSSNMGFTKSESRASLQLGRCDLDAVILSDHDDLGTDDLPLIIRKHLQLALDQRLHVLPDVGKIVWRGSRIESLVAFDVLLKLLRANLQ